MKEHQQRQKIWITDALNEVYPSLSDNQVNGLAVRGLGDVYENTPSYFNSLLNDLGFNSVNDVIAATDPIRDGDIGTPCN